MGAMRYSSRTMRPHSTIRLDLLSAALRHIRDAEHLADVSHANASLDQAYHLVGFGPECARKSVLSKSAFDKAIGHSVEGGLEALDVVLALDPSAHRYRISNWEIRYPALTKWTEQARYERTGSKSFADAAEVIKEASAIVNSLVFALWADGRIPAEFTW